MKEYLYIKSNNIPLYKGKAVFILSNSINKIKEYLPDFKEIIYAHSIFSDYKQTQGFYIVLNFHSDFAKITNGTLTHEIIHLCNYIAQYSGFIADFNNDEPIAYLSEWITNELYKFINSKRMKIL